MKTNPKMRLGFWIFMIILATVLNYSDKIIEKLNEPRKQKTNITVCAPKEMKNSFEAGLKGAYIFDYKIKMTDDENSDIVIIEGSKDNEDNFKFAYSPFVVAFNYDNEIYNQLKKLEFLNQCNYNRDYYELDFDKIMMEIASGRMTWNDLKISKLKDEKINIYYPGKSSPYFYDFINFMIINANSGKYPMDDNEFNECKKIVEDFLASENTIEVSNLGELIDRCEGFPINSFVVFPEQTLNKFAKDRYKSCYVLYPRFTSYCYYYIKFNNVDKNVEDAFKDKDSSFYKKISKICYRSDNNSTVASYMTSCISHGQDVYNVLYVPKDERLSDFIISLYD